MEIINNMSVVDIIDFFKSYPPNSYLLGLLALILLALVTIYLFFHLFQRYKKIITYLAFTTLTIVFSFMGLIYIYLPSVNVALTVEDAVVREGPSAVFEDIDVIPAYKKLIISSDSLSNNTESGHYFVQWPYKFRGHLRKKYVILKNCSR